MPAWSSFGAVAEVRIAAFGNSHFTSSLPVTSNLLHWTVWLLSTTIYIGVKGVLCLFFESISGSLATAPDSHPVSLYLQSPPSVPLRLCALYSNSEIAQGDASVP